MNKYNKKELNKAITKAIDKGYIQEGIKIMASSKKDAIKKYNHRKK